MKDEYIRYLILRNLYAASFDEEVKDVWYNPEQFEALKRAVPKKTFEEFRLDPGNRYHDETESVFQILEEDGALKKGGDAYIGHFVQLDIPAKDTIIRELMQASTIDDNVRILGAQTLAAAARRIAIEDGFSREDNAHEPTNRNSDESKIPASDRVVTLNHNQIVEVDSGVGELLIIVDNERDEPNNPDETSLALGKIKAGREMVRAAILDLDLFRLSMIAGLNMLVEKYRDHAIGAAAGNLLSVILKHFGML